MKVALKIPEGKNSGLSLGPIMRGQWEEEAASSRGTVSAVS
jgi:hypothetical protein